MYLYICRDYYHICAYSNSLTIHVPDRQEKFMNVISFHGKIISYCEAVKRFSVHVDYLFYNNLAYGYVSSIA